MTPYAQDLWQRSNDALRVAEHDLTLSPDAAASRAYYAAFYHYHPREVTDRDFGYESVGNFLFFDGHVDAMSYAQASDRYGTSWLRQGIW